MSHLKEQTQIPEQHKNPEKPAGISRKSFLKYTGGSLAAALAVGLAGCGKDNNPVDMGGNEEAIKLGSGDVGILNYAYALEQLEAAFYVQVMNNQYGSMTDEEGTILTDIRDHEKAHRDFFKAALGNNAIPDLDVDFSAVDFSSRASVLGTAKAFEDLGVSAYNGAGQLIQNTDYLLIAGKIVSVEARHASTIRDLLDPKSASFAGDDIINANGLGLQKTTGEVLMTAGAYIKDKIDASELPQPQ